MENVHFQNVIVKAIIPINYLSSFPINHYAFFDDKNLTSLKPNYTTNFNFIPFFFREGLRLNFTEMVISDLIFGSDKTTLKHQSVFFFNVKPLTLKFDKFEMKNIGGVSDFSETQRNSLRVSL